MMPNDTATPKDAALRAVGRAVVNFQRLEHNLKLAARFGPLEGVAAKIQNDIERRSAKAQSFTLGQAVQAWLSAINSDPNPSDRTPDLFDPTIRMTLSLESSTEHASSHAEALKRLLEVRNKLIHGGLVRFDWNSPTECIRLIEELNAVNAEISVQIEFLSEVLRSLKDLVPDDASLVHEIEGVVPDTATAQRATSLCKCRTPPFLYSDYEVATLGEDATFGEVSLETCKQCGSVWLKYLIEDPGRTAAGRWWRVLVPNSQPVAISVDNAREFVRAQTGGFLGGSYFQSSGQVFNGRPNIF
jgi:hypothetical protein